MEQGWSSLNRGLACSNSAPSVAGGGWATPSFLFRFLWLELGLILLVLCVLLLTLSFCVYISTLPLKMPKRKCDQTSSSCQCGTSPCASPGSCTMKMTVPKTVVDVAQGWPRCNTNPLQAKILLTQTANDTVRVLALGTGIGISATPGTSTQPQIYQYTCPPQPCTPPTSMLCWELSRITCAPFYSVTSGNFMENWAPLGPPNIGPPPPPVEPGPCSLIAQVRSLCRHHHAAMDGLGH